MFAYLVNHLHLSELLWVSLRENHAAYTVRPGKDIIVMYFQENTLVTYFQMVALPVPAGCKVGQQDREAQQRSEYNDTMNQYIKTKSFVWPDEANLIDCNVGKPCNFCQIST